ncbi:hypothetical protein DQW50_16240 [Halorubrum sp. 48-1-W]|uniref:hypothetical protein n=1 Tax=Halorubrum sp. 48-1-W TaxID=2249761 RepID=UPI000DCE8930|nr:hypothetical protein [Halorubrum sp. 48-1-W]RAW44072.1 hypothetical protein DQW50_16240 [Halorubrum sp. 48-1-W]
MTDTYETKTVRLHLPEKGVYCYLMLTRFDGEGHLLADEGWRGEYIRYATVRRQSRSEDVVTGDAFAFIRQNDEYRDTVVERFVKDLDLGRISWKDINDEDKLSAGDVSELASEEGGEADD